MKKFAYAFLILLTVACGLKVHAQSVTDGIVIDADSMFRDMDKRLILLKGHVQVVFKAQHLSCDQAVVNLNTQQVDATGNVVLDNARVHVEGDRIVFNYKTNTGYIYNGYVESGQVVFEGDIIQKIARDHYLATNANYTACETCPPAWSFSGRQIDAEIGGYARIRRPVFKIGGIPILILPSIIVPLKSSRQSGLLVPSMGFSGKGGLSFAFSYFWAINRSQDMTLTEKSYELRGYKTQAQYRYVLSPNSRGQLEGAWIRDRALQKEYGFSNSFDRWFIDYHHLYELPEDYVDRANFTLLSDLRYLRDFPDELKGHGDPAVQNSVSITKSNDNNYFSAEADVYTNLLKHDPLASNQDAVHRFPEIRYSSKTQQLGDNGPYFNFDLDYVNFARSSQGYDDMMTTSDDKRVPLGYDSSTNTLPNSVIHHDGTFDPRVDLWRTGQRLDLLPTFYYPFEIAHRFDLMPSVTYRETQYLFNSPGSAKAYGFTPTASRRYVETSVAAKTEFSRVFGNLNDPKSERWKHSIQPEITYSVIPWLKRPDATHPFFGDFSGQQYSRQWEPLSDADLDSSHTGVQFDYNDRTYEKQVIDFALTNRLTRKTWLNGDPDYETAALFRVSQSYDINEAHSHTHAAHPWSALNGLLNVRLNKFETYTTAAYNPYANVTDVSSRVKFMRTASNYLQLSYTDSYIISDDYQIGTETRDLGVGAGFISTYLEGVGELDYSLTTHRIQSWSYGLSIRPPGRCWLIKIVHQQILGGDAQIHAALDFDFGGQGKTL